MQTKAFTLVEIMVAVTIIGLLAVMAFPLYAKVRRDTYRKTMINDARIVSNAAQQYFMDKGVTNVGLSILIGSASSNYVRSYSKGNTITVDPLVCDPTFTFGVSNALVGTSALTFDIEGHLVSDPY